MENWDDLKYVLALRRFASMTRAAKALNANPATVSRRIQRVSETVGAPLFVKDERGWRPTNEGLRLARIAEALDENLSKFDLDLPSSSDDVSGYVRVSSISFINQYFLAPRLAEFVERWPRLDLQLAASDERASLAYGEADVAIRLQRPSDGRLVGKRVARQPIAVFESAAFPSAAVETRQLSADAGSPRPESGATVAPTRWIGLPEPLDWIAEMRLGREIFGGAPSIRCDSFAAIAEAAQAIGGRCVLPTCLARQFPELRQAPGFPAFPEREVWAVYHETRRSDPKVACVLRWFDRVFDTTNQCLCGQCPRIEDRPSGAAR